VSVEVALIDAALVLGTVLLVVRTLRARGARRRRMASTAFYDRDAEHYGPKGHTPGSAAHSWHAADEPIAPSFSAMKRVHRASVSHSSAFPPDTLRPVTPSHPMVAPYIPDQSATSAWAPGPMSDPAPLHVPSMVEPPVASPAQTPMPMPQQPGALAFVSPAMPPPPSSDAAS